MESVSLALDELQLATLGAHNIFEANSAFIEETKVATKEIADSARAEIKRVGRRWFAALAVFFASAWLLQGLIVYAYPQLAPKKGPARFTRLRQFSRSWLRRARRDKEADSP